MNITLYKSKSSMNTVDKGGANLTPLLTVSGNFKNAQSILTPIVIIDTIDSLLLVDDNGQVVLDDYKRPLLTSRDASKEIIKANYCYIDELQRYYFISEMTSVRNGLWRVSLSVDVLESYKSDILNLSCIVDKQQNQSYNNYIDDGSYVNRADSFIEIVNYQNGFNADGEFILLTAGAI